jgi:hypothetical protein
MLASASSEGIAMGIVTVQLPQGLANEILNAFHFPLDLQLPGVHAMTLQGESAPQLPDVRATVNIDPRLVSVTRGGPGPSVDRDASIAFEDAFLTMCLDAATDRERLNGLPDADAAPLRALVARIPAGVTTKSALRDALRTVPDGEIAALAARFAISWETEWVHLTIKSRPTVVLGAPIVVSEMEVAVQVKGRLCITLPIVGKQCIGITSPRVDLTARHLFLDLISAPPLLNATGRFDDIDIKICAHIIAWDVCVKIPVTPLVNLILLRQKFKIVDFNSLEGAIPYSDQKVRVTNITPTPVPGGGLQAAIELRVGH